MKQRRDSFLFSLGGYHPEFAAPPSFPKLERLTIKLADKPNFRLILTGYLAITSNTRQVGATHRLLRQGGQRLVRGASSASTRSGRRDVRFVIDFDVEMKIKYKGMTLFGVSVSGRFTGPDPKRVQGEWSVDLWLFSIGGPFDFVHRRRPAAAGAAAHRPAGRAHRRAARPAQLERAAAAAEPAARQLPQPARLGRGARAPARRARRAPVGAAARDRARPLRRRRARGRAALHDHEGVRRRRPGHRPAAGERPLRRGATSSS